MGYRSEVAITVPNEAFKELVEKAKEECGIAYELIKNSSIYQKGKFTTMHFDYVKWYADYDDVRFIENFMRSSPYVFKRVGEDYGDIEILEGDIADFDIYNCVNIVSSLDIENAGEKITIGGMEEKMEVETNGLYE